MTMATDEATAVPPAPEPDAAPVTPAPQEQPPKSSFILYLEGPEYVETVERLVFWVHQLLIPVYGREVTSNSPWCAQWWRHPEALAQLHGLSMAWQELTGPKSTLTGPATWHRDFLTPVMTSLRDPYGPFAGCKPGAHREKERPPIESIPS